MGSAGTSDYVDWALSELLAGSDTPNLRILAGLPRPPYWLDVEHYFEGTLADLGLTLPEPRSYLRQYAREIARAIVSGETLPVDGGYELYQIWQVLDYPASLRNWLYLMDGLDPETFGELEDAELETAIRGEAKRLLECPDAP
jgi:hypothetical protein